MLVIFFLARINNYLLHVSGFWHADQWHLRGSVSALTTNTTRRNPNASKSGEADMSKYARRMPIGKQLAHRQTK